MPYFYPFFLQPPTASIMRLLGRIRRPVDRENQVELQNRAYLDQYQVDFDPLPPLSVRFKESYRTCVQSLKLTRDAQKTIFAIILNVICAVYQAVDTYRLLFPGSKVAATIYRTESTHKAWNVFFWIIALGTAAVNVLVIGTWAIWVYNWLRLERLVRPNRKVTARSRRWYLSASTTSTSQNSSIRSRCSTTVTLSTSAANMDAYSIPMTPAPATTIERGTLSRRTIPSESITVRSSNSTLAGRAGLVPVAMAILPALARRVRPSPSSTSTVCGSMKPAVPVMIAIRLRDSWLRTTSISRPTT